ncbi:MAG: phage tail tube protein [Sandaracinobacter sp.]
MISDTSIVLIREETAYGTFSAPVPATDARLVFGYNPTPLESEQVRRQIERGFAGLYPSTRTALRARDPFSVELCGSGTPATPTQFAPILRACLFGAPVVAVGVDVTYPLLSSGDGGSVSLLSFKGDLARMRRRGVRGNVTMDFTERQLPFMAFDLIGMIEGTTSVDSGAPAGVVMPTYPAPVEVNLTNTAVQLGGATLACKQLTINFGLKTEFYSTTGGRAIIFGKDDSGDRRSITGTARFQMPDPATKNYFADINSGVPLTFSLIHGTVAGNIVELTSTRVFLSNINISVDQGRLFLDAELEFVPSAANNELTFKTR